MTTTEPTPGPTARRRPGRPRKDGPPTGSSPALATTVTAPEIEAALMIQLDAFVDVAFVAKVTSLSERELHRRVSEGKFPRPRQIGQMRKAWNLSQVKAFLANPAF